MPNKTRNNFGGVLVLMVFAIFAVCILLILVNGAEIVRGVTLRDQTSFERRTAVQYLSTRIRQTEFDGVSVREGDLILTEEIDGTVYETHIYCSNGYLRELFTERGLEASEDFGEKILPLTELRAALKEEKLTLTLVFDDGASQTLFFARRKGESHEK